MYTSAEILQFHHDAVNRRTSLEMSTSSIEYGWYLTLSFAWRVELCTYFVCEHRIYFSFNYPRTKICRQYFPPLQYCLNV